MQFIHLFAMFQQNLPNFIFFLFSPQKSDIIPAIVLDEFQRLRPYLYMTTLHFPDKICEITWCHARKDILQLLVRQSLSLHYFIFKVVKILLRPFWIKNRSNPCINIRFILFCVLTIVALNHDLNLTNVLCFYFLPQFDVIYAELLQSWNQTFVLRLRPRH